MVNVAVIGVGSMGKNHARVYNELRNSKLIALADINDEVTELAKRYNCTSYHSYERMLKEEQIDAVSIAVPTALHKDIALDCLGYGTHILLEKPIASKVEDAKDIIAKANKYGKTLAIGHIERFNPAVRSLEKIIKEGKLGKVVSIATKRIGLSPPATAGSNVVIDLAIHDIDIANYLLGKLPKIVHGVVGRALTKNEEDYASLLLQYDEDISASIYVNWLTPTKIRQLSVNGAEGYAELDYITQDLTLYPSIYENNSNNFWDFGDFVTKFGRPNKISIAINKAEPLKLELEDFINSVEKDKLPLVSGEAGLEALKIALHALENGK